MTRRAASLAEEDHMARVAALGCIVCRNAELGDSPSGCHHINCGTMGRRSSHYETIPLCHIHHQEGDGTQKYGGHVAVHYSLEEFERMYGTEQELLLQTLQELG